MKNGNWAHYLRHSITVIKSWGLFSQILANDKMETKIETLSIPLRKSKHWCIHMSLPILRHKYTSSTAVIVFFDQFYVLLNSANRKLRQAATSPKMFSAGKIRKRQAQSSKRRPLGPHELWMNCTFLFTYMSVQNAVYSLASLFWTDSKLDLLYLGEVFRKKLLFARCDCSESMATSVFVYRI